MYVRYCYFGYWLYSVTDRPSANLVTTLTEPPGTQSNYDENVLGV